MDLITLHFHSLSRFIVCCIGCQTGIMQVVLKVKIF